MLSIELSDKLLLEIDPENTSPGIHSGAVVLTNEIGSEVSVPFQLVGDTSTLDVLSLKGRIGQALADNGYALKPSRVKLAS